MSKHGIYWNRFQAKPDKHLYFLCGKLKAAGIIHARFIDRWHVTNLVRSSSEPPIPVTKPSDLLQLFCKENEIQLHAVLKQHCPEMSLPELTPPIESVPSSVGNIIDAE